MDNQNVDDKIQKLTDSLSTIKTENFITSIIVLVVGIILVTLLDRFARKLLKNSRLDLRIKDLALHIVKYLLYLTVIIAAVSTLGINLNAIVAIISIASLGITLALESVISNMASGIMLITTRPFTVGQYIESEDKGGTVQAIHLNHTEILTLEGTTIIVPNKTLANSIITNFHATGKRRLNFNVSCAYSEPTEKVKRGFLNACEKFPEILKEPAPEIYVASMEESDIKYNLYVWTKSEEALPVKYGFMTVLRDELEKSEVRFAYPHVVVKLPEKNEKN